MKLATLKTAQRDGELIIVNRDLKQAIKVGHIVTTLQQALDAWLEYAPQLQQVYEQLNAGQLRGFAFNPADCYSPLPRAYQWADGSAYVNHVELVRKARGAELPANFWHDPLMYQGGSDTFLAPHEDIVVHDVEGGVDFEAEVAVITRDVPMGASVAVAKQAIVLVMLVNDVSLRNLIPDELSKGFGFFQSKPSSSFSPVAVTPDELGDAWDGYKLHLPLITHYNGEPFGEPNAGEDMTLDFPRLIVHAAKTRRLSAGCIIGSGTVSNRDRSKGSSCIAEKRMLEIIADGKAVTPFMQQGDTVRIEMLDKDKQSIFGAISQKVVVTK